MTRNNKLAEEAKLKQSSIASLIGYVMKAEMKLELYGLTDNSYMFIISSDKFENRIMSQLLDKDLKIKFQDDNNYDYLNSKIWSVPEVIGYITLEEAINLLNK